LRALVGAGHVPLVANDRAIFVLLLAVGAVNKRVERTVASDCGLHRLSRPVDELEHARDARPFKQARLSRPRSGGRRRRGRFRALRGRFCARDKVGELV